MQLRTNLPVYDDAAFTQLYQRYAQTLLSFIRRYLSRREDAEDVLLEVFLAAMERNSLVGLNEDEQLAWLRRVAHNKCMDVHRRARRHPMVSLDSVAETLYEDESQTPEHIVLRTEELALLRRHLAHLPEQQQAVLRLRFAHNLRSPEIARQLSKSEGSVRMLLARALKRLHGLYYRQPEKGESQDE
ncbi:MAG: sigma-70 family RNA polymerase sigma factor [Chloroflexota bacterium]|nr:sigma-70 family RNA polymerase sigma factor [Chloroflexota bacterium]